MINAKTTRWSKTKRTLALLGFATIACASLSGCSHKSLESSQVSPSNVASAAPSLARIRASYRIALADYGIRIIQVGQIVRVFIPSDSLFVSGSANIRPGEGVILATVARYIGTYKNIYVRVASYTDDYLPAPVRLALSDRRAEVVGNRIWVNGIDSRIVTALGRGAKGSVDSNQYKLGRKYNRRIEITFKFLSDHYQLL